MPNKRHACFVALGLLLAGCGEVTADTLTPSTTATAPVRTSTTVATTTSTSVAPTTSSSTPPPPTVAPPPPAPPSTAAKASGPKAAPKPKAKAKPPAVPVASSGAYPLPPTRIPAGARAVLYSGRCDWLRPHLAAAGLPATFLAIAARESGCAPGGVNVSNRTDRSSSRWGLNFIGSMPRYWAALCGVSDWRALGASVALDAKCAAAAFARSGYAPWRA